MPIVQILVQLYVVGKWLNFDVDKKKIKKSLLRNFCFFQFVILVGGVFVGYFVNIKKVIVSKKAIIVLLQGQETYDITLKMYNILISKSVYLSNTYFHCFEVVTVLNNHSNRTGGHYCGH
jgi:hypothetical protein